MTAHRRIASFAAMQDYCGYLRSNDRLWTLVDRLFGRSENSNSDSIRRRGVSCRHPPSPRLRAQRVEQAPASRTGNRLCSTPPAGERCSSQMSMQRKPCRAMAGNGSAISGRVLVCSSPMRAPRSAPWQWASVVFAPAMTSSSAPWTSIFDEGGGGRRCAATRVSSRAVATLRTTRLSAS